MGFAVNLQLPTIIIHYTLYTVSFEHDRTISRLPTHFCCSSVCSGSASVVYMYIHCSILLLGVYLIIILFWWLYVLYTEASIVWARLDIINCYFLAAVKTLLWKIEFTPQGEFYEFCQSVAPVTLTWVVHVNWLYCLISMACVRVMDDLTTKEVICHIQVSIISEKFNCFNNPRSNLSLRENVPHLMG